MLSTVLDVQLKWFSMRKISGQSTSDPVPPAVKKQLADIIIKSRPCQSSVNFVEGTDMMEETVVSHRDPFLRRRVVFSEQPQKTPSCCSYYRNGSGFSYWNGVAVICEKHGSVNLHKYISERYIYASWKKQYEGVSFYVQSQYDIDEVMSKAKRKVDENDALHISVALAPLRGRPSKNCSKRLRAWYERGPAEKRKRAYTFELCGFKTHTDRDCQLQQIFDEEMRR